MRHCLLTFAFFTAAFAADKTYTGEIMDSQCADMASHDNMMKGENAHNAKECTISCVKGRHLRTVRCGGEAGL